MFRRSLLHPQGALLLILKNTRYFVVVIIAELQTVRYITCGFLTELFTITESILLHCCGLKVFLNIKNHCLKHFDTRWYRTGSRDSSVGIATRYGREGPVIESRWDEIFRTYPDRLRGPPNLLYNGYRVFAGGKGGRGVMLATHPLLVPRLRKS